MKYNYFRVLELAHLHSRRTLNPAQESLSPVRDAVIAKLLDACFDGACGGSNWFKQIPHERLLAWSGSDLIGLVGVEFRVERVGKAIVPVLGIVDLFVAPTARRQGIGAALLQEAEERARGQSIAIAMGDDPRLYQQTGYRLLHAANVTFLAIDELRRHRVMQRELSEIFIVRRLASDTWPERSIDFLGHLF